MLTYGIPPEFRGGVHLFTSTSIIIIIIIIFSTLFLLLMKFSAELAALRKGAGKSYL